MPLYEFSCRKCSHRFEELTSLAEVERRKPACPACGSRTTERALSSFATGAVSGGGETTPCGSGGFT